MQIKLVKILQKLTESEPKAYPKHQKERRTNTSPQTIKLHKIDIECLDLITCFVIVLWCDAYVVTVLSDEPRQNQGRGLVDRKLVKAPQ